MHYDTLIEGARIVDGTGAPWFRGAVGIIDDRIETVIRGDVDADADDRLDIDGDILAPGFVDTHSHSDLQLFEDPTLAPKLRQGITTEVFGQDGFSMAPLYREGAAEDWQQHLIGLSGQVDLDWSWESLAEYLDAIESTGVGPNVATLVGHGTVRFETLGMAERAPDADELEAMADLVTEGLEDGAIGFSTGLVYAPQVNASTREVRTLAERLAPYGRPFVAHIRSESEDIWAALDEFVDIGAETGVPLHLSHYKVSGPTVQGQADRTNHLIEAARDRGVDFTAEQYPYTAGNTMLSSLLPSWALADSPAVTLENLEDSGFRDRIKADYAEDGPDWSVIDVTNIDSEAHKPVEGMSLAAIGEQRDQHPVDVMCDILVDEALEASIIARSMSEPDVRTIMANERVAVATDGLFGGKPHPRTYGTYPRVLGTYVREANLLTVEEAVRKMTSLPARAMGFDRRGIIRPGMAADLVVFDPGRVADRATYEEPRVHPAGISHVMVNGSFGVRDGATTGATPGSVIRA
ncbi:MAG: amidohydrolase family protein [Halobacteriales archaeon]